MEQQQLQTLLQQRFTKFLKQPTHPLRIADMLSEQASAGDELALLDVAFDTAFPLQSTQKSPMNQNEILSRVSFISSVVTQLAAKERTITQPLEKPAQALAHKIDTVTTFLQTTPQMRQAKEHPTYITYADTLATLDQRLTHVTLDQVHVQLLPGIPKKIQAEQKASLPGTVDITPTFKRVLTKERVPQIEHILMRERIDSREPEPGLIVTKKLLRLLDTVGQGRGTVNEETILWLYCTPLDAVNFSQFDPQARRILEDIDTWQDWITSYIAETTPSTDEETAVLEEFLTKSRTTPTKGASFSQLKTNLSLSLLTTILTKTYFHGMADARDIPHTFTVDMLNTFTENAQLPHESFTYATNIHKLRLGLFDTLFRFHAFAGQEGDTEDIQTKRILGLLLRNLESQGRQMNSQEAQAMEQHLMSAGAGNVSVIRGIVEQAKNDLWTNMKLIRIGQKEKPLLYIATLPKGSLYEKVFGEGATIEFYSAAENPQDLRTHFTITGSNIKHPIYGSLQITERDVIKPIDAEIWSAIDLRQQTPTLYPFLLMTALGTFADMSKRASKLIPPKAVEDRQPSETDTKGTDTQEETRRRRRPHSEVTPVIRGIYASTPTDTDPLAVAYSGTTPVIAHTRTYRGAEELLALDHAFKQAQKVYGEESIEAQEAKEALRSGINNTYKASPDALKAAPLAVREQLELAAILHPDTQEKITPATYVSPGKRPVERAPSEPVTRRRVRSSPQSLIVTAEKELLAKKTN